VLAGLSAVGVPVAGAAPVAGVAASGGVVGVGVTSAVEAAGGVAGAGSEAVADDFASTGVSSDGGVTAAVDGAGSVDGAVSSGFAAAVGSVADEGVAALSVSGIAPVVGGVVAGAAFDGGKYVVVAPLEDVSEAARATPPPAKHNAQIPKLRTRRAESLFIPKWLR
jgi:hypothetical protein